MGPEFFVCAYPPTTEVQKFGAAWSDLPPLFKKSATASISHAARSKNLNEMFRVYYNFFPSLLFPPSNSVSSDRFCMREFYLALRLSTLL